MGEGSQAARAVDVLIECACSLAGRAVGGATRQARASVRKHVTGCRPLECSLRAVFAEVRRGLAGCACGGRAAGL